jgi:hypothetical protein
MGGSAMRGVVRKDNDDDLAKNAIAACLGGERNPFQALKQANTIMRVDSKVNQGDLIAPSLVQTGPWRADSIKE